MYIFHHFDKYNFVNNLYLSKYSPLLKLLWKILRKKFNKL